MLNETSSTKTIKRRMAMLEVKSIGNNCYGLSGELTISELEDLYNNLLKVADLKKQLTFDLTEVTMIDSAAIQLLISFKCSLKDKAALTITKVSNEVEETLRLMGLYYYFIERVA